MRDNVPDRKKRKEFVFFPVFCVLRKSVVACLGLVAAMVVIVTFTDSLLTRRRRLAR